MSAPTSPKSLASPTSKASSTSPTGSQVAKKKTEGVEYLECSSALQIVPEVDEPCLLPQRGEIEEMEEEEQDWLLKDMEPIEETFEAITRAKKDGNSYFEEGKLRECIDRFSRAIIAAESLEEKPEEVQRTVGILHSNRSLAFLRIDPPANDMIITDCNAALQADPANFKAQYRRACALSALGDYERAFKDISKVLDHYDKNNLGSNPQAVKLRDEIIENLKQEKKKWAGHTRGERIWNRAIPNRDETSDYLTPKIVLKPRPKTKWTPVDVEKYLQNKKTGADFWDNFCPLDIFQKAYAKVGMSVDAFAHLLQVLPDANFDEETKRKYLEVALKTLSPTVLHMLSADERQLLEKMDKRQLVQAT